MTLVAQASAPRTNDSGQQDRIKSGTGGARRNDEESEHITELASKLADVRLELAKRDADVQYLEGELAQVHCGQLTPCSA